MSAANSSARPPDTIWNRCSPPTDPGRPRRRTIAAIPILNIDIGGGTTKLALVEGGNVMHTAAIHLGGRLAVFDAERRLTRLDPAGQRLAALAGCTWTLGDTVSEADIERVTSWMADALVAALTDSSPSSDVQGLWLTDPFVLPRVTDAGQGACPERANSEG